MADSHAAQHVIEFGGSAVSSEFPGRLKYDLKVRIPVIAASGDFDAETARGLRYMLIATWGPERPSYQRYPYVVLDLRMVQSYDDGASGFIGQLRDRLRQLGGDLFVALRGEPPTSGELQTFATADEALEAARDQRRADRAEALGL